MTTTTPAEAPVRRRPWNDLPIADIERLCDDAVAVTFDVPEHLREDYAFAPGQSLILRRDFDGETERRNYSLCAQPGGRPRVGVRLLPGGRFSEWLVNEARRGDTVSVRRPTGRFVIDPDRGGRHVFVAAGSGITPILSMVSALLTNPDANATVIYGNRTTRSVMFADELADLKDTYPTRLDLVHVLSREPREVELFNGRLDRDRLHEILQHLVPVGQVDGFWLCGPYAMTTTARDVLADLDVPRNLVHAELFFVDDEPPPPPVRTDGPDTTTAGSSSVSVTLDGRTSTLNVARDQTVLDGAQAGRGDVPFACKGGVCGTCRARLTHGSVDMRRNYALEDDELEAGFVLTCQSVPTSDEVAVDYDA